MRYVLLYLFVLLGLQTQAQVKNIQLGVEGNFEPSVAVSKKNVQQIVVTASPDNIYYSQDKGASWQQIKLTQSSGNLVVASDFKGKFYCVYHTSSGNKTQVAIRESEDGGKTWSEGVVISTDSSRHARNPSITVDRKGNVYVSWTEFDLFASENEFCTSRILLSRSSNGRKWSKPVELSQTKGNCKNDNHTVAGSTPAIMADGQRSFAVWANQNRIFFDRAFDGSTWLSNDLAIAEQKNGWKLDIPGVKSANGLPTLLIDNTKKIQLAGALYVTWSDQATEGDANVWLIRSTNFGDNWTQRAKVYHESGAASHQYNPKMALDSETGYLYIIYYEQADDQVNVFLSYSMDAGAKFKNIKISERHFVADSSAITGNYIGVSAHAGVITASWTRTDNGQSSVWACVLTHEELEKIK